ncbi:hypothetical protein MSG28_000784 [Choristoneura fumiferana]|uniref:Uncharacterized protein n=1 Tax=Choristoneura fumiferana TaxID=7141 RepID=A0ACC0K277_CHOFU|nr:hypothetical protein MSG28_000784 [Choristoneura fumiferana]
MYVFVVKSMSIYDLAVVAMCCCFSRRAPRPARRLPRCADAGSSHSATHNFHKIELPGRKVTLFHSFGGKLLVYGPSCRKGIPFSNVGGQSLALASGARRGHARGIKCWDGCGENRMKAGGGEAPAAGAAPPLRTRRHATARTHVLNYKNTFPIDLKSDTVVFVLLSKNSIKL